MSAAPRFRSIIGSPLAPTTRLLLGVLGVVLTVAAYEYYIYRHELAGGNPRFSPGFGQLWAALGELTEASPRTGSVPLWTDTWASLWILARGLGTGVAISAALGLAMGVLSTAHALCSPVVTALAKVPPTALIALFMVMFGVTGDAFKVALIAFGITPTLALGIALVARAVPRNTIVKAYSLGASTPTVIVRAIVPQIIPQVIEVIRLAVGPAWIYLIAAEYVSSSEGIGHGIVLAQRMVRIDHILVYVAWLALLGSAMDVALHGLSRLVAPWAAARRED
ncbi:MAG TPA: ABC transporter permease subunit [Kofleriaceae bacterium]|nr:ABC transporter permease subunit [Kofleriaceae bacterium]